MSSDLMDLSQFQSVFFEEAAENLASMEDLLIKLDLEAPDLEDLNAIFRAAHSLKGGSATFGFSEMTHVTHELETLLDKARRNELHLNSDMVDVLLESCDVLKAQLAFYRGEATSIEADAESVTHKVRQFVSPSSQSALAPVKPANKPATVVAAKQEPKPIQEKSPEPSGNAVQIKIDMQEQLQSLPLRKSIFAELSQLGTIEQIINPEPKSPIDHGDEVDTIVTVYFVTEADESAIKNALHKYIASEQITVISLAQKVDEEGYGFFDDEPTEQTSNTATSLETDEGYGFFEEATSSASHAQNHDTSQSTQDNLSQTGYGFFDDPIPVDDKQPSIDSAKEGYGFFEPLPEKTIEETKSSPVVNVVAKPEVKVTNKTESTPKDAESASIRVSVEKVDQLINMVGELVITQSMLAQTASQLDPTQYEALFSGLSQLERNTRDLQESVMSVRMMPIAVVFNRFPRLVRDLASKLGKQVQLKTIGERTELDKGLVEKVSDPLTHLVRNCLDHGLEMPEVRMAAGKAAQGTVTLRAFHQGGSIVIEVSDDGRGLNREKILAKAKERGLPVNDNMSDQDVWQLIFEAGFSTAEQVTDLSGRGVGMDVVKRNIHSLGGRVEIDSAQGLGTRISIRLPLTLAILDGMSIGVGQESFIIPLAQIIESLCPDPKDIKPINGQGHVLHVRGEYLPIISLKKVFNIDSNNDSISSGIMVILEADGIRSAFQVDELLGQHQVVVKSIEGNYKKVPGLSGATIMGDGKVAFILDVPALVRLSKQ